MWLARHTPQTVLPRLHKILTAIKEEYADSLSSGGGLYAAGYCFGAKYVLLLAGDMDKDVVNGDRTPEAKAEEGMVREGPAVKCAVVAHGTSILKEDMEGVKVPVSVVAVEKDSLFPDEVREAGRKALEAKGVEHEVEVYSGVPHGFAVLGDYEDGKIVEAQRKAFAQMLGWLKAH